MPKRREATCKQVQGFGLGFDLQGGIRDLGFRD